MAVILRLESARCRDYLRGILRYQQVTGAWEVRGRAARPDSYDVVRAWQAHGIITEATTTAEVQELLSMKVPVVNLSGRLAEQPLARVTTDNLAVGQVAAEYFLARGYRTFGALADEGAQFSEDRLRGFQQRLAEAGHTVHVHRIREDQGVFEGWERADDLLAAWMRSLPKPVAILTDDVRGPILSLTCGHIGIAVPEQAAILGVDNDELLCRQAQPPLSSVSIPHEEIGYQAARLLDSLMAGKPAPADAVRIKPIGVITRASTDILAIEDPLVAEAVRYINDHAQERINVGDVVDAMAVGRRVLEYRFRRVMHRSVLSEIHRVRVERAKMILVHSKKSLPAVAEAAGFRDIQHMTAVFRKHVDTSPAAWRRANRV